MLPLKTNDTIFATGVFLAPLKCIVHGVEQWRWVAVSFEDDSYLDGEVINPEVFSDRLEDLAAYFDF